MSPYVVSSDVLPVSVFSCVSQADSVVPHVYLYTSKFVQAEYVALKMPSVALSLKMFSTFIFNL